MAISTASNTNSTLLGPNGRNITSTGISTNIIIKVDTIPVGAIQSLTVREERQVQMVDEVGTDGHIDSVPIRSANFSGDCRRIRFDRARVTESFGRDFLHIHAQRIPFDIDIYDTWQGDGASAIVTTIKNVWITNLSYGYMADNWIITDDMSFVAETMYSTLNGGPAATGGVRGDLKASLQIDSQGIERAADTGSRRGALDFPNLLEDLFQ